MNSFTFIISTFFPEIDIFKTAFEFPADRNSPINQDFVSYSFINSLHFGRIKYENDSKISILNNCINVRRPIAPPEGGGACDFFIIFGRFQEVEKY